MLSSSVPVIWSPVRVAKSASPVNKNIESCKELSQNLNSTLWFIHEVAFFTCHEEIENALAPIVASGINSAKVECRVSFRFRNEVFKEGGGVGGVGAEVVVRLSVLSELSEEVGVVVR